MNKKLVSCVLGVFLWQCLVPAQGMAAVLSAVALMPPPGVRVASTPLFVPATLQGMSVYPEEPFTFDFLIAKGDQPLSAQEKPAEYNKLIKYFLAALAVPDKDQWVNLSPFEANRIIPDNFGSTAMGRDLLAQDYLLKQFAASLTDPDTALGKEFWAVVYAQAYQQFGSTDVPMDTIHKVWILPDKAVLFEKDNTVYVLESHLKVMTEQDYLAMSAQNPVENGTKDNAPTGISSQILQQILIPAIEKEVNEGQGFAPLRQVFSGMLLATWYKRALKESLLGQVYADKGKVNGIHQDPQANQEIYDRYVTAFKQGVFNLIREETDAQTHEMMPHKYFSGGVSNDYNQAMRFVAPGLGFDQAQAMAIDLDRATVRFDVAPLARIQGDVDLAQGLSAPSGSTDEPKFNQISALRFLGRDPDVIRRGSLSLDAMYQTNVLKRPQPEIRNIDAMPDVMKENFLAIYEGVFNAWLRAIEAEALRQNGAILDILLNLSHGEDRDINVLVQSAAQTWSIDQIRQLGVARSRGELGRDFLNWQTISLYDQRLLIQKTASFILEELKREMVAGYSAEENAGFAITEERLLKSLRVKGIDDEGLIRVRKAMATAKMMHRYQRRRDGRAYYVHLLAVLEITAEIWGIRDVDFLVAAMFHDQREDQPDAYWEQVEYVEQEIKALRNLGRNGEAEAKDRISRKIRYIIRALSKLKGSKYETMLEDGKVFDRAANLVQATYETLQDPGNVWAIDRNFPFDTGSPFVYDVFIQQIQLIKLADILMNLSDLESGYEVLAEEQKALYNQWAGKKFLPKVTGAALEFFLKPSSTLTPEQKKAFYLFAIAMMKEYQKLDKTFMDLPDFAREAEGKFQKALALLSTETPVPSAESIDRVLTVGFGQGRGADSAMKTDIMVAVADLYELLLAGVTPENMEQIEKALTTYITPDILRLKASLKEVGDAVGVKEQKKLALVKDYTPGILKSLTRDMLGFLQTVDNEFPNNLMASNLKHSVRLLGAGSVTQSQFARIQQAFQDLIDESLVQKFRSGVITELQAWLDVFLKTLGMNLSPRTKDYLFQALITINFNNDFLLRKRDKANALARFVGLLLDHADTRALRTPVINKVVREIVRWLNVKPVDRPVLAKVLMLEDKPAEDQNPLSIGTVEVQAVGEALESAVRDRDLPAFMAVLQNIMDLSPPASGDLYRQAFIVRLDIRILLDELQDLTSDDIDWDKINQMLADPAQITDQGMLSWNKSQVNIFSGDSSAVLPTGGIDFAQSNLSLYIKRDGAGVPLPVNQQNLAELRIEGLVPVILAIQPLGKFSLLSESVLAR